MPAYLIFLILIIGMASPNQPICDCKKATNNQTTFQGNESIRIDKKIVLKELHGMVTDSVESVLPDSLVEVFQIGKKQKRVMACWVDRDGHFCFKNIPKGIYEVRISRQGFKASYYEVEINPNTKMKLQKNLKVYLMVAT